MPVGPSTQSVSSPPAVRYGPERFFYDQRSHLTLGGCSLTLVVACSSSIQLLVDMLMNSSEQQIGMGSIDCLGAQRAFTHENEKLIPLQLWTCLKLHVSYCGQLRLYWSSSKWSSHRSGEGDAVHQKIPVICP